MNMQACGICFGFVKTDCQKEQDTHGVEYLSRQSWLKAAQSSLKSQEAEPWAKSNDPVSLGSPAVAVSKPNSRSHELFFLICRYLASHP